MRSLHLEKRGLRGLAIAESFRRDSPESILAGVVMDRNRSIDGFVFGTATLDGDDSTQAVSRMYHELRRSDISYILMSGMVISMYNIVDLDALHGHLGIPVIGISYRRSGGLDDPIIHRYGNDHERLSAYRGLGRREMITLRTGSSLFVRSRGCSTNDARHLLDGMTMHGSVPEPVRVARLLARSLLDR